MIIFAGSFFVELCAGDLKIETPPIVAQQSWLTTLNYKRWASIGWSNIGTNMYITLYPVTDNPGDPRDPRFLCYHRRRIHTLANMSFRVQVECKKPLKEAGGSCATAKTTYYCSPL